MVHVTFEKDNSTQNIGYEGDIEGLLQSLKINPETVIVAKDNTIVEKKSIIQDSDKVLIISVISGG